jgi:NodT family efflux transporter outer membrane factor (OMF) lipoprotein
LRARRRSWTFAGVLLVSALVVWLGGCGSRPASFAPPVATPSAFSQGGQVSLPDAWWTSFDDARLDTLVATALRANLDLQTAWERLREARAVARIAGAPRWPSVDGTAAARLTRPSTDPDGALELGLLASYEVDLWGRIGARTAAERLRAEATLADYRATALSLSAEVTLTWYQLVETRAADDLVARQIATNEKALTLLQARFGTGQVRQADILRQRRLLEATRERALDIAGRRGLLRHQLAVLLGRAPAAASDTVAAGLPEPPPLPRTGVPAELLQRRPDVRAAYLRLQAADRDLAAAVSDRYPRLSLTGSVTTTSAGADQLFDDWLRSVAGGLLAPLFRGGELSAAVDRAEARRQRLLAAYGQAVLTALREVEDALVSERVRRQRIASLERQVDFAERTHRRLRLEFFNGVGDFLDVLTARVDLQQLQRDLLAARLGLLADRIALSRALAGAPTARLATER